MTDKIKINQALDRAYEEFRPFSDFYQREKKTYRFLLKLIIKHTQPERGKIIDIGTGIGIMPLALKFLGFESCGIDRYIFSIDELDKIKIIWQKNNLLISDYDMAKDQDVSKIGSFDVVLSSSTIEHIKSPRIFLQNIKGLLKSGGLAMILTPNASFISKRIRFLFGFSPFCELKKFFDSDGDKFSGHWREYTLKELKQMCVWAGLKVVEAKNIDNSPYRLKSPRDLYYLILKLISLILPGGKRAIVVICQK